MIALKDVSKRYGDRLILDAISIDFPRGKLSCLVGRNGTGKSSILAMISRLISKDSGSIYLVDQDVSQYSNRDFAKRVSILKQSNQPNIRLRIRELVAFGRFPHSQGRLQAVDHQKIAEAIVFMGLEAIQDSYLDELSGGQKQRAFLAMVLVQDTEYILLDEPLNNLDMKHSVEIMKILRVLADQYHKTIIVVLHDINFAASYADYIAAIKDRKIQYFGPTAAIIKNEILKDIFAIDMTIIEHENTKICIYFK